MTHTEIQAKSILNKKKYIDSWFVSRYSMNIYRGCSHACAYCDGRYEGYYVDGDFEKDISVKMNAPILLDKALDPARKRKPLMPGFVMLGGGVSDSYQPIEKRYEIVRQCLGVLAKWRRPLHLLTKSNLVLRDLDLFDDINRNVRAIISMSFSTVDNDVANYFEPGCPSPTERLEALKKIKAQGIGTGVFLLPVIPGVTDKPHMIEESLAKFKDAGVDFVLFGGMTLKQGRQKEHFMNVLNKWDRNLVGGYNKVFLNSRWGNAIPKYYGVIEQRFIDAAKKHGVARRMPGRLFCDVLDQNDYLQVILEQLDYLQRAQGDNYPFGEVARFVATQSGAIETDQIPYLNNKKVLEVVKEILSSGTSAYYQDCLS